MNVPAAQKIERSSGVWRPKKFTPERIQQIINLVERGKSPAEIAQLIGVPVGSLSVTCSRLGISLRAPRLGNGIRQLRPVETTPSPLKHGTEKSSIDDGAHGLPLVEFRIAYKGKERTYRMPLTSETITRLALDAELQGLTMGELMTRLMTTTLKKYRVTRGSGR
jgi:hypothetical protein